MKVTQKKAKQCNTSKEIRYTHIETNSSCICFMLSGAGYTFDNPLFYYAAMTMLQNNIDIVHIHYPYDEELFKNPLNKITEITMDDVTPVVTDVLEYKDYSETIFIGKSLGTIPIAT